MTDIELRTILSDRLAAVRGRIADACRRAGRTPADVTLVAVTKSVSPRVAGIVADLGTLDLGESRPQEVWKKAVAVPHVRWHLIGHLQRNKVDRTVPLIALFHAVDSVRLLEALDEFGRARGVPIPVLLEVNCSREESKGGFSPDDVPVLGSRFERLAGLSVRGLMTMAPHAADPGQCRSVFAELRGLRDQLRSATGLPLPDLSMGMSNDYEVAIEEGATLMRLGSTLFNGLDAN